METCPVCRASLNGASTCRRCRADLQKVLEVAQRGQALVGAAMQCLAEGDLAAGAKWLDRARAVHATPAVRVLRSLAPGRLPPGAEAWLDRPACRHVERTDVDPTPTHEAP